MAFGILATSVGPGGRVRLLQIEGTIDRESVVSVRESWEQSLREGFRFVVLHLGKVPHVDSTGLGYLVNSADALRAAGGGVAVAHLQPAVAQVFTLLRLGDFLTVVGKVDEAFPRFGLD